MFHPPSITRREFLARASLTLPALVLTHNAWGSDRAFEEVQAFVMRNIDEKVVPGAALIVSRGTEVVYEKAWGTYCSRTEKEAPLDASVVHTFFSYSKIIGATVLATLVQEGKLSWDTPIADQIPEFGARGKEKITLRHLLSHSAGIPNVPIGSVETEAKWDQAVQAICEAATEWEPGSRSQYHGLTGQLIAAEAARRSLGGKSWSQIARERLFAPLGAVSLTYEDPVPAVPFALVPQPGTVPAQHGTLGGLIAGHPAGGCHGTLQDGLKILQLHLQKGKWNSRTILTPEIHRALHTVQFARQIAAARAAGKPPQFQSWGLGPLLRGEGPSLSPHDWFGFRDQKSPGVFGHAGISTVIGVADPETAVALLFVTTDQPQPESKATPLRNGVTNRVMKSAVA